MEEIKSKIKFYSNGKVEEICGSENFVKKELKNIRNLSGKETGEKESLFWIIIGHLYNFCTSHGRGIVVLFIVAIVLDYIKLNLTKEILSIFLGGLIVLMGIFSAITVAFGKVINKGIKLSLWKNFRNYFRYTFLVIIGDSVLLILPTELLDNLHQYHFSEIFSEIFSLLILALNIYAIFLMIKATEQYFDENL